MIHATITDLPTPRRRSSHAPRAIKLFIWGVIGLPLAALSISISLAIIIGTIRAI